MNEHNPQRVFFIPVHPNSQMTSGGPPHNLPHPANYFFASNPVSHSIRYRSHHENRLTTPFLDDYRSVHPRVESVYQNYQIPTGFEYGFHRNLGSAPEMESHYQNQAIQYSALYHPGARQLPEMEQHQVIQNTNPGVLQGVPKQQLVHRGIPHTEKSAARSGCQNLQSDFGDKVASEAMSKPSEYLEQNQFHQRNGLCDNSTERDAEFKEVWIEADKRFFADIRPVLNFTMGELKEYRLFEDRKHEHKNVVENLEATMPATKLQTCPIGISRGDNANLLKAIFDLKLERGADFRDHGRYKDDNLHEDSGVGALTKLFLQIGNETCVGSNVSIDMNLDELMKDLDDPKPIVTGFAGPFADTKNCYDSTSMKVTKGFKEYDFPFNLDNKVAMFGDPIDFASNKKGQMKREIFNDYSIDTLLFIFYNLTTDISQLLAANQMFLRGWKFHKLLKVWITPWISKHVPGSGFNKEGDWSSGIYQYFDQEKWKFCIGHFKISKLLLEQMPPGVNDAMLM